MVKNSRQLTATADGGFEIEAETAFDQVVEAVDNLYSKCGQQAQSAEFGAVSSFWHSLVGVDENGAPTTKLFAWAETRPAHYVSKLRNDLNAVEVQNRTGCPFHSSYWPAKILWIKNELPDSFAKTAKWLSFPDFMGERFYGRHDTSISMASGTGIFDLRKQEWDPELLDYLGIAASQLPPITHDDDLFTLSDEYSTRWPHFAGSRWLPPVGDGAANNIGAGCFTKERAALMIGTSGAMRVVYEGEPPDRIPDGLWCYRVGARRIVIGGAISDGGGLYRWLQDNLLVPDGDKETGELIAARMPDCHGLTFLPFLAGERSTGYNDFATGAVLGLRTATNAVDIVQAALESVAYRFAEIYNRLNDVLAIDELVASGGALRESPAWTQMICDVLGMDMTLPETREASSRGVVLLASEKAGLIDSLGDVGLPEADDFKCDPAKKEIYDKARERHTRYYESLVQD